MKDFENFNVIRQDFEYQNYSPQVLKKYYVEFNRMLYSKRCIYFYIFLIFSSITIFLYSLIAYFFQLDEQPIIICESVLIVIITVDMLIRVYVNVKIN